MVLGDLVVVVPGVTGSSLTDARGKEVWGLGTGSLVRALRTLGDSLQDLALPEDFADGPAPDGVLPTRLIMGFHGIPGVWTPVEGYRGLVKFLSQARFDLTPDVLAADAPPGNLVLFAYDWRLSNRWSAKLLKCRVERALTRWRDSAPERRHAKVVFICHSMGGLVARWYIDREGGAEVTRSLITLGTPHRGALGDLERLVNGVHKGLGPLRLDLTRFARSLPSSYELLPEYACIESADHRSLVKTTECEIPTLNREMVSAGMSFHDELDERPPPLPYALVPVVGIGQPTSTTARIEDGRVLPLPTINGHELMGDGTVPRLAALPKGLTELDPSIKAVAEGHGALPVHRSVLDQLDFVLTSDEQIYRTADVDIEEPADERVLGMSLADLHQAGEPVEVTVCAPERWRLEVVAVDESGEEAGREQVSFGKRIDAAGRSIGASVFDGLAPGGYTLLARTPDGRFSLEVPPVRATTLVWLEP